MTVLYVFSPTCGWCKRNSANMRSLALAAGKRFDLVALSLTNDGAREFAAEHGMRGEVYVDPSPASRSAYGLGSTPQTIVVGPDGKVLRNWSGAYTGKIEPEVASVLGVRLPGLAN